MSINCQDCGNFKAKLYSKNDKFPDSRCGHESALVGRDDDGRAVSWLTIREARLPRSDRKEIPEDEVARMREYNQCGPNATFFVKRK